VISEELYKEVLAHLWEVACLKHPEMWAAEDWMLLHDNAPAYDSLLVL